jgi:hypothetical protein
MCVREDLNSDGWIVHLGSLFSMSFFKATSFTGSITNKKNNGTLDSRGLVKQFIVVMVNSSWCHSIVFFPKFAAKIIRNNSILGVKTQNHSIGSVNFSSHNLKISWYNGSRKELNCSLSWLFFHNCFFVHTSGKWAFGQDPLVPAVIWAGTKGPATSPKFAQPRGSL